MFLREVAVFLIDFLFLDKNISIFEKIIRSLVWLEYFYHHQDF